MPGELDREEPTSALRDRLAAAPALAAALPEVEEEGPTSEGASILRLIRRLKAQIGEKQRIIEAKTAELVATRDYLRRVFGALTDAVLVIDPRGRVEFANQAALELLDYRADQLIGREARSLWADPVRAADFQGERLARLLEARALQRSDLLLQTRRGQAVPVSWSSAVLEVEGEPARLVGIARDVRIERRLEEEKLRAVQALAASVAHEIRNPLGALQNAAALLRRDLDLSGEDRTLMDIVGAEAGRIAQIVDQFLEFARPPQPTFEPGCVAQLLREVLTLAERDERAEAGRQLLLHVDPDLPALTLDANQVKQVVWNLVSNALDAARERVAVRARRAAGGVEVLVSDDGPGMPPDVLARAFEPFRTTKARGSGLGLAICKRIIEAHGGSLRLESVEGAGTRAAFFLPAAPRS